MKWYVGASAEINPDFMSSMIMKFTKAKFSHVFITDGTMIYHSTGKGVNSENLYLFSKTHKVWLKEIDLKVSQDYFKGYLRGSEGMEYSQSQYLGFIFKLGLVRWLFKNGREKTICSEYVANTLNDCCGYHINDTDWVSPKDVFNFHVPGPEIDYKPNE